MPLIPEGISEEHAGVLYSIHYVLMVATLFWLVRVTEPWVLHLFAVAFGGCVSLMSPLIAELLGLTSHGLILAIISLGFTAGAAVGPAVTGYMFNVTGSYQLAFLVCAVIGGIGLVITVLLRPITSEPGK